MKVKHGLLVALLAIAVWPAASTADGPVAYAAATCSDYPNQKAAQEAADTRDADGDGIYCVTVTGAFGAPGTPHIAVEASAMTANGAGGTNPENAHGSANQRSSELNVQHCCCIEMTQPSCAGHNAPKNERLRAVLHRIWCQRYDWGASVASGTPILRNLALIPVPIFHRSRTPR